MSEPAAAATPPTTADPQDPLPEGNWLWRRVFVFAIAALLLAFKWWYAGALGNIALSVNPNTPQGAITDAIEGLIRTIRFDQYLLGGLILFYLLAPSAEQLVKIIQTARFLREGGRITSTAAAASPAGQASSYSTAGKPPEPAPPAPEPAPAPRSIEDLLGPAEDRPIPSLADRPDPWAKPPGEGLSEQQASLLGERGYVR